MGQNHQRWIVAETEDDTALSGFLRTKLEGMPWKRVKALVSTGKIHVNARLVQKAGHRLKSGDEVALNMSAHRQGAVRHQVRVCHCDRELIVIDKPEGLASVPYADDEPENAMIAAQQQARRRKMGDRVQIVHRLDKATSGVLVFALRTRATRGLKEQFREHSVERCYFTVAHGHVESQRIESQLVANRGDGLRGSTSVYGEGKVAVTHVKAVEHLNGATLCEVRLETGRTHQIRIHLSELGHPIVGDTVYTRDAYRRGAPLIDSPRLLLHAATLGFTHPGTGQWMRFNSPLPGSYEAQLERLRVPS